MVDRTLAAHNGDLAERAQLVDGLDTHLALINPEENTDKYYVLQGLEDPSLEGEDRFYSFQHWGRTGTRGDAKLEGPTDLDTVKAVIAKVFKDKTGNDWGTMQPGDRALPGKYWVQQQSTPDEEARWEYYVGDGVDGKRPGWYPYEASASEEVESIYAQHEANARESRTSNRIVDSGYFSYLVDLVNMTQQNTKTKKVREIRRVLGAAAAPKQQKARRAKPEPKKAMRKSDDASAARAAKTKAASGRAAAKATAMRVMRKPASGKGAKKSAMRVAMKKPTKKAMKKVAKKPMKKAMKKAKKPTKIARGKRARSAVWKGSKEKTGTGLKKEDLKKNKDGKLVSAKKSALGRAHFKHIAKWVSACKEARKALGLTGFQAVKKGSALYDKAKELYPNAVPLLL
eukprot:TRINITY_DN1411_c0_g4_i1.p1 TRINITY_DN1411_c0_g4~~TRINITY_DN1411_c0_g4_i1.p1  ORF type:complete len:400 (+),score=107.88 TRINITY_DN1411_c0_g4_i1:107-1306(+)